MIARARDCYRRLARRVHLALGRRPCRVRIKVYGTPADVRMDVTGVCAWWATREDVSRELNRAWRSARRQFARRRGIRLVMTEPLVFRHVPEANSWIGR